MFEDAVGEKAWLKIRSLLGSKDGDAQLIFWGPEEDIKTALETIEERCKMAFAGVPNETRKSFADGTTIFERVLPGADRMYPDTDSAPIPLEDETIEEAMARLPKQVSERMAQLRQWDVPEDAFTYILKNNLMTLIENAREKFNVPARFTATLFAHTLKHIEGQYPKLPDFSYQKIYELLKFLSEQKLDLALARKMLLHIYQHPKMDYESILTTVNFKQVPIEEILAKIPYLVKKYQEIKTSNTEGAGIRWVMGNLSKLATGNISLKTLSQSINF
jgi:glutamyl-tRNA(Gln) amidotransferase subunit E